MSILMNGRVNNLQAVVANEPEFIKSVSLSKKFMETETKMSAAKTFLK